MKIIVNLIVFLFFGIAIYSQEPGWKFSYDTQIPKINLSIYFQGLSCYDELNCICSSAQSKVGARIFKTTNGGISWEELYTDTSDTRTEPWYVPRYIAGYVKYYEDGTIIVLTRNSTQKSIVLKSVDYGKSWKQYKIADAFDQDYELIYDRNLIYVVSMNGTQNMEIAYYSKDGGESWKIFPVPDSIKDLYGLYRVDLFNKNTLIFTKGITDTTINDHINFNLLYTCDLDGNNWKQMLIPKHINRFKVINDNILFGYGYNWNDGNIDSGYIYKSYDGGKNWELKFKTNWIHTFIQNLEFFGDSLGYAIGRKSLFIKTTDQGETWFYPKKDLYYQDTTYYTANLQIPSENVVYYTGSLTKKIVKYEKISGSVSEPSIKNFNLYPNPLYSADEVNLEFYAIKSGDCKIYLTDTGSRQLAEFYTGFVEEGILKMKFQLPKLSSGAYWLVIEMNGYNHIKLLNIVN